MIHRRLFLALGLTLVLATARLSSPLAGQGASDSVDVVIGPRYGASALQRLFLGDHYRDAWTSTVTLPVLDLQTFAGGLTAEHIGGGQQTISLVFLGGDGRRYSFRLIDKDPTPVLPPELRETAADALLQDQISASHPLGILIVHALEDAAGVLHPESRPFVMPDDPALGAFREQFAGQAGAISERPGDEESSGALFGGFDNIDGGTRIFRRVAESQTERVDSRAFLNARLLDVLIGDWDRHRGQWTWARPSGSSRWLPIAEDRDQAFSRLDGLLPSSAHTYVRHLVGFVETYPNMYSLHHQARELDRQFLAELDRGTWDSVAVALQRKMTDQVIDEAVRRLPDVMFEADGAFLSRSLKARRDELLNAAAELYEFLAMDVEVHLTDLADRVEITALQDGHVRVTAQPSGGSGDVFFDRDFDPTETREIRIFMGGADDLAVVGGIGHLDIVVRVVGGEGNDEVRYTNDVGSVRFYDAFGVNKIGGDRASGEIQTARYEPPPRPEGDYNTPPHSGSWTIPRGGLSLSPEYGFVGRLGATRRGYGFRRDPYASRFGYGAAASTRGRFEASLGIDLYAENSSRHFSLDVLATQLGLSNFYGFGNDSRAFVNSDSAHVLARTVSVEPRYGLALGEHADIGFGVTGLISNTHAENNPFLPVAAEPEPLYGAGLFVQAGAFVDFRLDTRDVPGAPTKGATLQLRGTFTPSLFDVTDSYGSLDARATTYLSAVSAPLEPTLALRAGGKRVWGNQPFFSSAFVGGGSSLRGFDQERFAGDASLYGTAELRIFLFRLGFLTSGDFGLLGFADVGRVYLNGASPDGWHTATGGGVWLGIFGRTNGISAVMANSEDGNRVHIAFGMPF